MCLFNYLFVYIMLNSVVCVCALCVSIIAADYSTLLMGANDIVMLIMIWI